MNTIQRINVSLRLAVVLVASALVVRPAVPLAQVPITVEGEHPAAPVTLEVPFPKGVLHSVDHVRVLNGAGHEIACQITEVSTWLPADESVKWIWVDFFTDGSGKYTVGHGPNVRRTVEVGSPIHFVNNQRPAQQGGGAEIDTGPLRLWVNKGGSGFLDRVEFDQPGTDFTDDDLVAEGVGTRGSFLDLLDQAGPDSLSAVVEQQFIEKGSGPLHAIVRVEGEYRYARPDHPASPFVTYIHGYAGKSYIKVFHTITYTGKPDQAAPLEGRQHQDIATQGKLIIDETARSNDPGITKPNDMIASAGFGLRCHIAGQRSSERP